MKSIRILSLVLALISASAAFAAQPPAGPKGGRILNDAAPFAEVWVAADRSLVVTFYDKGLKPLPLAGQTATAVVQQEKSKTDLTLAPKGDTLVSSAPLPAGDGYTVVVRLKENPDARPKNYRFAYHDELCAECKRPEYACACGEHGGEKEAKH